MPTAEQVKGLTFDTLEVARGRAEELAAAANRAASEVREHASSVELPSIEVPNVDELVHQAASHRVRTALVVGALVLALVLLLRKVLAGSDEPAPAAVS